MLNQCACFLRLIIIAAPHVSLPLPQVDAATGIITTVAGSYKHAHHYAGDGGPATQADLQRPSNLAIDAAGNLYIADSWNFVIRMVSVDNLLGGRNFIIEILLRIHTYNSYIF